MNKYLDISREVKEALNAGKPVVALESTIISHGMPYPQNVETALAVEDIVRKNGATPATIAIIGGRLKAGLTEYEIRYGQICCRFWFLTSFNIFSQITALLIIYKQKVR